MATGPRELPGPPSPELPIPQELDRFLGVPGPRLVFVRGPEGTGKAAIAARILQRWGNSGVWVGTRGGEFDDSHADGSDPSRSIHHVDLSWAGTLTRGTHEDLMAARDALGGYYRGQGEVPPSDDWLPPELAVPLRALASGTPPTVAIDSWEGFVNRYLDLPGGPPGEVLRSGRVERLLLGLMVARGTRLVAISEYGDSDILESMADAVLVTAAGELEDRLVRIFSITKLRGFPVDEPVYPYTLDGGRFQFVPRHTTNPEFQAVGAERDPHPTEIDSLWPGSAPFAAAFGRLAVGTVSIVESDPSVPEDVLRLISAAIFLPVLARGGRVLITLPADLPPEQLYRALRTTRTDEQLLHQLRLISPAATSSLPAAARRLVIPLQSASDDSGFIAVPQQREDRRIEPLFPESTRFLQTRNSPASPNLAIVPIDALQAAARTVGLQYTPEAFAAIVHEDVATNAAHVFVLARSADPLLESVRAGAQPYLRLVQRQGRLFIFGVRPWTPMFALLPQPHPEVGPPFDLIRIS